MITETTLDFGKDDWFFRFALGGSLVLHLLLLLFVTLTPPLAAVSTVRPFEVTFLREEAPLEEPPIVPQVSVRPRPVSVVSPRVVPEVSPPPSIEEAPRATPEEPLPPVDPPASPPLAPRASIIAPLASTSAPVMSDVSNRSVIAEHSPAPVPIAVAPGQSVFAGLSVPSAPMPTSAPAASPGRVASSGVSDVPATSTAEATRQNLLADYRALVGQLLGRTMNRRFQREAQRRDEGVVTFYLEVAATGVARITEVVSESPLLERLTRVAIVETRVPAPPTTLPSPLVLRYRTRFMLEGG